MHSSPELVSHLLISPSTRLFLSSIISHEERKKRKERKERKNIRSTASPRRVRTDCLLLLRLSRRTMLNELKSSSIFQNGQRTTKPFRRFLRKFLNDWSMDFSAMLAYNLLIALLPIAVALFGTLGLILTNYPDLEDKVKKKIIESFPADNTTRGGIEQVRSQPRSFVTCCFSSSSFRW